MTMTTTDLVDRPKVTQPRRGVAVIVLSALSAVILTGYSWVAITGHQFGSPDREEVPASVRASPGGYRSFHFWHSGYHGGK